MLGTCWVNYRNSMLPRRMVNQEARTEDMEHREEERANPPPPPPDMQAQMLAGMTQFFAQFAGNQAAAVGAGARPQPEAVYERFRRMSPKEFSGTTDPMVAEGWIKSIEVIFDFMELADADRVRCAIFLLTGEARLWWESASVAVNLQVLPWNGFKEVFYSKYFTEEVRTRLTNEFMTLRQGDSSVADFVRKFEKGCHFVPLIANDVQAKLRHFLNGLRPILRRDVRVAGPTSYVVAVSRALAAEQDQRDIEADRQGKRPYQAPPQHQQQQQQRPQFKRPFQGPPGKKPYPGPPKGKGPIQQQGAPQKPGNFPVCQKCNRQHPGQCLWGSGKCFKCGATDHMLKECPQWKQPTQGRVFAMHAQEADPDTTLLTGDYVDEETGGGDQGAGLD
ncbi:uncharacterized protein LOC142530795 [Primulina tabacum]|uniref:uncharacterized protein LOC142530795 n=1 Tax=Primulina tabacum TaxID=48773 RepID=UPI003F5AA6DE